MMIFDSHIHTNFSADSAMLFEQAKKKADLQGIGMITTEHLDFNYPDLADFTFDFAAYFEKYGKYRGDEVQLGIEVGMRPGCLEQVRQIVEKYPFDYVIGSIHMVGDIDIYFDSFYQGRSKAEAYGEYFAAMLECVKTYDFIDALGHIDYIARYGKYVDAEINYAEFQEPIDLVLKAVVEKGKAMEINTRRFGEKKVIEALLPIYKRFRALGGEFVTLGSDAHTPDAVGNYFAEAIAFAEACKLQPVYFSARKPVIMNRK